jgi:tetratricopeptide (TPR) repeat protein
MDARGEKHMVRFTFRPSGTEAYNWLIAATVICLLLSGSRSGIAAEPPSPDQVIDVFLEACSDNETFSEEQQKRVIDVVSTLRKDDLATDMVITQALRETNPDFAAALIALAAKDTDGAVSRLRGLVAAEDPYLAAASSFYLARAYVEDDDYERALPLLENVIDKHTEHTLHIGEAMFLRGISESHLLKRVEAMESFTEFLKQYPNAPQRMLAAARQNLELLEQIELGSINDIHDHMQYSHRRLSLDDSGTKTQEVQDDIVAMLTSLIEETEKQGGT